MKRNVTFNDIAKYTNFSKTTISRYFNKPDSLTLENQKIIKDALAALDYKENKVARILANGKTEFVGIIIPNLYLHYYSQMLNELLSTYESFGYKFLVFIGNEKEAVEQQYVQELLSYKIEGLIILSHTISSRELASYNIPIVAIEREDEFVCSVNTDNYMGGVQATVLLAESNCDVLIHVNSAVPEKVPSHGRINGFLDVCEEYQIAHELILKELGNTNKENREKMNEIMNGLEIKYPGKRLGIFMSNDTFANVLLNILIQKYGTLPPNYRIVGFDNSPISSEAVIPISTVAQHTHMLAIEAMKLLKLQMDERKKREPVLLMEPVHKMIPPELIRRETTD